MVKYVRRHSDPSMVVLHSDNPAYDDMDVARADICALYRLNDIITEGTTYNKCVSLIAYLSAHLSHNPAYDNHIKTGLADLLEFAWDGEKKRA